MQKRQTADGVSPQDDCEHVNQTEPHTTGTVLLTKIRPPVPEVSLTLCSAAWATATASGVHRYVPLREACEAEILLASSGIHNEGLCRSLGRSIAEAVLSGAKDVDVMEGQFEQIRGFLTMRAEALRRHT